MSQPERLLPTIQPETAAYAVEAIDEVNDLYMQGARTVLRRILSIPDHDPRLAQENIAEHSWSVAMAARTLWENRGELGIGFHPQFDINRALSYCDVHDLAETKTEIGDIDAMCQDEKVLQAKTSQEIEGFRQLGRESKYLGWVVQLGIEAEQKRTPEAKFMSDVDKHVGTRIITRYARYRWWGFAGEIVTRDEHTRIMRGKLQTPFGHGVFDAIEEDFDRREAAIFAESSTAMGLFPPSHEIAEIMRTSFLHKMLMGKKIWPDESKKAS